MEDKVSGTCDACGYKNVKVTQYTYLLCDVCASTHIGNAVMEVHGSMHRSARLFQTIGYATNMILECLAGIECRLERIEAERRPRL